MFISLYKYLFDILLLGKLKNNHVLIKIKCNKKKLKFWWRRHNIFTEVPKKFIVKSLTNIN